MGALVLTQPMFERLRRRYPSAELYVLCSEQNRQALELLDIVRPEHVVVLRIHSVRALLNDIISVVRRIRALNIDAVLDLELFARLSAILAGLSGAALRVGFDRFTQEGLYRGTLINRTVLYNPYLHISQQFITLADAIGSSERPAAKREADKTPPSLARLQLRPGELEAARLALAERHPSIIQRPLVFLAPGGGVLPIRAWPITSFCAVSQRLIERGFAVAILGLATDHSLAVTIRAACNDTRWCFDLTGYTRSIREVAVLLHLGALLITNDGGTGHTAALTPIPSIVLFGPETPVLYGSVSTRAVNLHKPLSCSPCVTAYNHRRSPCDGDNVCLKSIAPDEVLAVADELLARYSPVTTAAPPTPS